MDLGCSVGLLAWEMFVGLAVYQATFVLLCSQCFISSIYWLSVRYISHLLCVLGIGGDTEPEILFMHAYDHRRWRIAQTIERLSFNLCLWV